LVDHGEGTGYRFVGPVGHYTDIDSGPSGPGTGAGAGVDGTTTGARTGSHYSGRSGVG
ncbi:hypothetical protein KI387_011183, partial [Taxus chinensis]